MSTLSLLSRGNAQVVRITHEKIVIHYEPEDYFNWKSRQDFHIKRFLSGRYTSNYYWAVPTHKTYSTRKGALVLYSEDLALPAWNGSQDKRAKKRQRYKRKKYQIELSTLQDLTGAILSYGRKEKDHSEPHWQPYLHFLNEENIPSGRQIRPGYSPKRYLTRLFRTWDPNTVYKLQQAGSLRDSVQLQQFTASGDSGGRNPDLSSTPLQYHRLPAFTSLPYWSNADRPGDCTPVEEENGNEVELAYEKEILEVYGKSSTIPSTASHRKSSPEQRESHVTRSSWKVKEQCNSHMVEAQQNPSNGDDAISSITQPHEKPPAPVDMSFCKETPTPHHGNPHTTFYGGPFAGRRKYPHNKQQKDYFEHFPDGPFLPPVSQSVNSEAEVLKDPNTKVQEPLKLPPIIEEASKLPQRKRRRQATDPPKELLVIPLLVRFENQKVTQEDQAYMHETTKNGIPNCNNIEEPAGRKAKREEGFNEEQVDPLPTSQEPIAAAESRVKTLQIDIDWNVDANTDGDLLAPEAPALGSLPPISGKKGPGNQSSMANLKASNASNSASAITSKTLPTGIIRGSLPEELKECCKGNSVGSLIMGPDGEIVCLSLMGATRDADIPIRFDFIPEEEEEDCLPVESAGQEEQWGGSQQDFEREQDNYTSFLSPANSTERISPPPYPKGKKGKRKNHNSETSLQEESADVNVQEFGPNRIAEKIHEGHKENIRRRQKKDKPNKLTEEKSDQREDDIEERYSRTTSPEQEDKHYSAETGPENGNEASSTRSDYFQDQNTEDEGTSDQNMQKYIQPPHRDPQTVPQDLASHNKAPIPAEASGRSTPDKELPDASLQQEGSSSYTDKLDTNRNSVLTQNKTEQKADQEKENEYGTDLQMNNEHETSQAPKQGPLQPTPDATNIRPKLKERKSHHERNSGQDTIGLEESKNNDQTAPSTGQNQDHSKKSSQEVLKDSGKPPNLKPKTSEVLKTQSPKPTGRREDNPETSKDVEKVSSEKKDNLPVTPPQTEVGQEYSHIEKQQLTEEEEELALLQELTNPVTKETTKAKGRKKGKSEKVQKAEKAQASPAKKVNQKAGAEQGKAFLAGQPKNKKGESKISSPKKASEPMKLEETIHETHDTPQQIQEEEEEDTDTEKESEDSYVVIEYHERTPTPSESDTDVTPQTSEQTAGKQVTATLEVPSQANEDDNANSDTSEVTSSSVRQRRSSRAREISEKAEKRRLEVERKRREREEQLRLEKEQQERMDKMKEELEQEQLRRAEEIRLRKKQEEDEKQRQEQERTRKMQLQQQALERERQQQEEYRRKLQEIQQRKQQEELERIELERQRQKEAERLEAEERLRLQEMAAEEREEYQRKKREREEQARREEEERRLKAEEEAKAMMEEAQRQAQLLAKQTAALEQQLQFNRGLQKESVGMDQTQGISRPWVFSYFEFLELLGMPLPVEGE